MSINIYEFDDLRNTVLITISLHGIKVDLTSIELPTSEPANYTFTHNFPTGYFLKFKVIPNVPIAYIKVLYTFLWIASVGSPSYRNIYAKVYRNEELMANVTITNAYSGATIQSIFFDANENESYQYKVWSPGGGFLITSVGYFVLPSRVKPEAFSDRICDIYAVSPVVVPTYFGGGDHRTDYYLYNGTHGLTVSSTTNRILQNARCTYPFRIRRGDVEQQNTVISTVNTNYVYGTTIPTALLYKLNA